VLLIGVDEAGYGPKLGPLCHGWCAFRCAESDAAPDLWRALHPAVTRHPAPAGAIAVDDSKRVFSQQRGLAPLVAAIRAFLRAKAVACDSLDGPDGLLRSLLPDRDRLHMEEDAWGQADGGAPHPVLDGHPTADAALRQALASAQVSVVALGARAMSAKHFNAALGVGINKADVSWRTIAAQLQAALALAEPRETIHIAVDRQGGRRFYAAQLANLLPGCVPWAEQETALSSVYRIEGGGRTVRVAFLVNGDQHALTVALASMAAKLTRELYMARLNAFFLRRMPGIRPTAGYASDAGRFLRETAALRKELSIADATLVRAR
jgi:hypothetical protein